MKLFDLKSLLAFASVATVITGFSPDGLLAPAAAQAEPVTLNDILESVRRARSGVSEENREREARFIRERNRQRAMLADARAQASAAEAESARLDAVLEKNKESIRDLDQNLAEVQGEFQELFGAARSAAADLNVQVENSVISSQFPGRGETLTALARTESLPTEDQLRTLWEVMVQQIAEQAATVTYDAEVAGADGVPDVVPVTRIGPFVAFSGDRFLVYRDQKLRFLERPPAGKFTSAAKRVSTASGDGFVRGVVDPSLGTLLSLVVETPTLSERVDQGRFIGKVIIFAAAFGVLLGFYKWVTLTMSSAAVNAQIRQKKPSKSNPLGRVMLAYDGVRSGNVEAVSLKLDDAILKEVPKLESGLNLVKVLAAVAPLLGLLGTVIGMINTFQAITLFGTGDPQIMASGISEALVTTVLGLVAAIPLLLIHAFASGSLRQVTQVLEEQSAGIIAAHAEKSRA